MQRCVYYEDMRNKESLADRMELAVKVYDHVLQSAGSFEEEDIGADLAYLMGAILKSGYVEFDDDRRILEVLAYLEGNGDRVFPPEHVLWTFIEIMTFKVCDSCGARCCTAETVFYAHGDLSYCEMCWDSRLEVTR